MDSDRALERLVRHYSPSGAETPAVREFVRIARALGYRARTDAVGNGVATRGRGRPELLFLGHIDTVEGRRPVRRRGGRVSGRGSVDAKGAIVTALLAGRSVASHGTLRVVAAVGEETDSRGAHHLLHGRAPDGVIAGEPSGWDGVTVGYKGILRFEAEFRSPRAHSSSPEPSAPEQALAWWEATRHAIEARRTESNFRSWTGKPVGWTSDAAGPVDRATLTVDLRLPPGLSTAQAMALLPREPGTPRIRVLARIEPAEVLPGNPVAAALVHGVRAVGARPTLWRKGGTSDLNLALTAWGIPGAAYGPGDSRLDHTARESVSRLDLDRAVAVLRHAFAELLGEGPDRPATLPRSGGARGRTPRS